MNAWLDPTLCSPQFPGLLSLLIGLVLSCPRAFAHTAPSAWHALLLALSKLAPSHPSGLNENVTSSERPSLTTHPVPLVILFISFGAHTTVLSWPCPQIRLLMYYQDGSLWERT